MERDAELQVTGPALCQNLLMRSVGCPLTTIRRSFGGVKAREYFNILWGLGLLRGEHQTGAGMETGRGLSPTPYADQGANSHGSCGQGFFAAGQLGLGCH